MERLTIAASHDPALAALRDALPAAVGLSLELAFMGSLHALERLATDRVAVAGFHLASTPREITDPAPFRRLLNRRRDRLIRFVDRDQGFILPRANPARVRTFADVARKRLRFVNRQRGSGTRLLIDRVLGDEGVDALAVRGYANEEFTHAAVAATVASGAADAGFGLRGEFWKLSLERQLEMIYLHNAAAVELTFSLLPPMIEARAGGIINVSSIAGFQPIPYAALYSATKSFLTTFSMALREELRSTGVKMVTVCPGRLRADPEEESQEPRQKVPGKEQGHEEVVMETLKKLDVGGGLVIPGRMNRLTVRAQRLIPPNETLPSS